VGRGELLCEGERSDDVEHYRSRSSEYAFSESSLAGRRYGVGGRAIIIWDIYRLVACSIARIMSSSCISATLAALAPEILLIDPA
jgi:hypothetical protein